MSDSEVLYKIYGQFATKINPELVSEAIENAIPEEPLLLSDSDIDFLRQFDEEYWTQALYKRNEKLFRYLVNLDNLRKKIRNAAYEAELEEVKNKYDQPIFAKMNPFVKKRQIKSQADSAAKAVATKLLPAGKPIEKNVLNHPLLRKLKRPVKSALLKNINNINNYYLGKDMRFEDLRTGRSAPETIIADPKIGDLAKNIEGEYGSKVGHDLHNPRILQRKKVDHQAMKEELKRLQDLAKAKKKPLPTMDDVVEMHKDLDPKFVTDGFVFPSYTEIQSAVREKLKSVLGGLSVPQDDADNKRLDIPNMTLGSKYRTVDAGVHPTEKQMLSNMEDLIRSELNAENLKRRAAGQKEIDKPANKIRDEAKQRIRQNLKNYMPENFKDHLKRMGFSDAEIANANNPYGNTNIVLGAEGFDGDSRLIKQNPTYDNEKAVPHMSGKIRKLKDGIITPVNKMLPALFKSGFYKDVKLQYPHDNQSIETDTTATTLLPGNELGEKFFDKEIFERLVRRINFLKRNPSAPEAPAVAAILKKFNLDFSSNPNQIIDAASRYFYQKADKKDYKQGSNVSSTWSHHPTRLSAKLDFFNRYHDKAKYDKVVSALLEKGVKRTKNAPAVPLFDFIAQDVNNKLDIKANDTDELPKLVMQRVKDTIIALVQLRIFDSLGNPDILKWYGIGKPDFSCFDNPGAAGCFGNGAFIGDIVNKEIKRIKDQDLFTGSIRKRGQLAGSEDNPSALTCKQGERGWQTGRCVYGADLRTINDYFRLGNKKLEKLAKLGEESSAGDDDEDSIVEERKKIRLVLEGLNEMNEAILVLLTALNRARDPKISDQDAKINAKHELTDFLKSHIRQEYPEFIRSLYNFYNQSFTALKSIKPKESESLSIPTMIRHRRENRPTTKRFFSKRFDAAAQGKDLTTADEYENAIATANLNKLNKIYDTTVRYAPSMADKVYQGIIKKLEDPKSNEDFVAKNGENNQRLKVAIEKINDPVWVRTAMIAPYMFLGGYRDTDKHPPTEWSNFYTRYVPYLNDKNLIWLSRFLAENIDHIPLLNEPDSTPEEKAEGRELEAKLKPFIPLRHFVINYLHDQIKKRNLMTSLIARVNKPEHLEQFEKSTKEAQAAFTDYEKLLKKVNARKQQ